MPEHSNPKSLHLDARLDGLALVDAALAGDRRRLREAAVMSPIPAWQRLIELAVVFAALLDEVYGPNAAEAVDGLRRWSLSTHQEGDAA